MSIQWVDAEKKYYVVMKADSYDPDDYLTAGERNANGKYPYDTSWPDTRRIVWFDTLQESKNHPALRAKEIIIETTHQLNQIDTTSDVVIAESHAAKAAEAYRVKFENVTDLDRIPYIAYDQGWRPTMTILEIADEWWAEYVVEAEKEGQRSEAKRQAKR